MTVPTTAERQADVSPTLDPGTRNIILAWPFPPAMTARLQTEQHWSADFTERALSEYRRFLVLAMCSAAPVTPSVIVDEVWHTHLMFTRDYWDTLTPQLPRALHHDPGTGDAGDPARFARQYADTLALYERTFGTPAPTDVWGSAASREEGPAVQERPARLPAQRVPVRLRRQIGATIGLLVGVIAGLPLGLSLASILILGGSAFLLSSGLIGLIGFQMPQHPQDPRIQAGHGGGGCGTYTFADTGSSDGSSGTNGGSDGGSSCGGGGCGGGGCGS